MIFTTHSADETIQLGKRIGDTLKGGETLLLTGQLGAGKTQFTKGIALGLGIDVPVTSPTFVLHNIYSGRLTLNHFDFYRICEEEAVCLGLEEFFGDKDSVCVAEWWSNVSHLVPPDAIEITFTQIDENTRRIEIVR